MFPHPYHHSSYMIFSGRLPTPNYGSLKSLITPFHICTTQGVYQDICFLWCLYGVHYSRKIMATLWLSNQHVHGRRGARSWIFIVDGIIFHNKNVSLTDSEYLTIYSKDFSMALLIFLQEFYSHNINCRFHLCFLMKCPSCARGNNSDK